MGLGRRDLLKLIGLGGGAGMLGAAIGRAQGPGPGSAPSPVPTGPVPAPGDPASHGPAVGGALRYNRMSDPPAYLGPRALDARLIPPPPRPQRGGAAQEIELRVIETALEVGHGAALTALTYNGTAPGPILRAGEGEELRVTLVNTSSRAHTVHFHGAFDASQDGWQPVPAGERRTYRITPQPAGLHPYHCHTPPYAWHIVRGMYGVMIVDPPGGRPPAHEFVLVLSGWDLNQDQKNELYTWNGVAGYYDRFPIRVPVGELVRLYLANLVEYDPCVSFHLHAHTFDVFRSGTSRTPQEHTDVVTLGPTERAILEFRLPRRGRYMFHPHQSHMVENGAMGWLVAV